ncbi:MAG: aminopeptidase N [Oceanicoccus sp.]|jgi:aminopeptidase N
MGFLNTKLVICLLIVTSLISCSQPAPLTQDSQNEVSTVTHASPSDLGNPPQGALPLSAIPLHYQLDLNIDPSQDSFTGHAIIKIKLFEDLSGIWLHGKDLRVSRVELTTAGGLSKMVSYDQKLDSGVAWVDFGQTLEAGDISLSFEYQADFDTNLSGLFKVEEQGDVYVLAKSESIQARKYLPGFDQPGFKSPYLISMTIPKGLVAISNAPQVSATDINGQQVKIQFAETRSSPTYLLSIGVGPFDVIDKGVIPKNEIRDFDIPLRAFARRGRAKDMNFVMDITPRYVEIFERALGQPYPFKKLDIIAAPQWPSGATELSAAITYREQKVLLGDKPAPGARLSIMNTHAHELAHMWFGNLVTPPWWDDLWLKEGFATWATPVLLNEFEPDGGHQLSALLSNFRTMSADALASTRAIRQPILKNENIRNAYDSITYRKSQAIIHMVDSYFGSENFRKAMGSYVAQYADGVADSAQFYQSISEQTGEPALTETFRQFAEQKGVPSMRTNVICQESQKTKINFSQSRYRPLGSEINDSSQWTVPICVRYGFEGSDNQKECGLVNPQESSLTLNTTECPTWLMPNADGSGYYRWELNSDDLNALFENYNELNNGEKIALFDAVLSGFEAGDIDQSILLKAIELSSQSDVRQLVELPLGKLGHYIHKIFSQAESEKIRKLVTPWYLMKIAKLDSKKDALSKLSESEQLLKNNLVAFVADALKHKETRQQLVKKAQQYIAAKGASEYHELSSDLYSSAFKIAVQSLGKPFFDQLIAARSEIDDPLFDNASAAALGALSDPSLSKTLYEYAFSDSIGSRESFGMIGAMLDNDSLQATHWSWVQDNLPAILEKIPAQWRRASPRLAGVFCEEKRIDELNDLFSVHGDKAPGNGLALAQTKESIMLCATLRKSFKYPKQV